MHVIGPRGDPDVSNLQNYLWVLLLQRLAFQWRRHGNRGLLLLGKGIPKLRMAPSWQNVIHFTQSIRQGMLSIMYGPPIRTIRIVRLFMKKTHLPESCPEKSYSFLFSLKGYQGQTLIALHANNPVTNGFSIPLCCIRALCI